MDKWLKFPAATPNGGLAAIVANTEPTKTLAVQLYKIILKQYPHLLLHIKYQINLKSTEMNK